MSASSLEALTMKLNDCEVLRVRITICNFVCCVLEFDFKIHDEVVLGCQLAAQTPRSQPYSPLDVP